MQSASFGPWSCEAGFLGGAITEQKSSSVLAAPGDRLAMEILSAARLQLLKSHPRGKRQLMGAGAGRWRCFGPLCLNVCPETRGPRLETNQ